MIKRFFFIILVFFIWKAGRRFGPTIIITELKRRSLLEHVYACGKFLWDTGQRRELLAAMRQAINIKIKSKLLTWDTLSITDQLEILKHRTGLEFDVLNVLFVANKAGN